MIKRTDIATETWQNTHKLYPFTVTCIECKTRLLANIPFQDKFRVGLTSEECPCGRSIMCRKVRLWTQQKQENLVNKNGELLPLAI